jgi:predicted nucleic acid-binding protein
MKLDDVFTFLETIDVNLKIADQTIEYRKANTKKIELPDAVILATARSSGADLITNNLREFEDIDPVVSLVEIGDFKV